MPKKVELATIKREFLSDNEADLTYVVLEKSESESVIARLHNHGTSETESRNRKVPTDWLNIFDEIEAAE